MATGTGFAAPPCPYNPRMTRAQAIARRTAGTLKENCVVVITDGPVIGITSVLPTEIELNPVSPTELGMTARVHTAYDNDAWAGIYDIDQGTGRLQRLEDHRGNVVVDQNDGAAIIAFDWGNLQWTDNYVDNSLFTAQVVSPATVDGSRFIDTAVNFTGWVSGTISNSHIEGTGTHTHTGSFSNITRSKILDSTWNVAGRVSVTDSEVIGSSVTSVNANATATVTLTKSTISGGAVLNNQSTTNGLLNVSNSEIVEVGIQIDAGTIKNFVASNGSFIGGFGTIRLQAGTALQGFNVSATELRLLSNGNTILHLGDKSVNIGSTGSCNISLLNTWTINGTGSVNCNDSRIEGTNMTFGSASTSINMNHVDWRHGLVSILGSGAPGLDDSVLNGGTIRTAVGTTGVLDVNNGSIVAGTVAIDSGPRSLHLFFGCYVDTSGSVIQTSSGLDTTPGILGDRLDGTHVEYGGHIEFQSTAAGVSACNVARTRLKGGSVATDGLLRFAGACGSVFVDQCEIEGQVIFTGVPQGALSGATAFHNNHVDAGSVVTYSLGDATAKQIRDNYVTGQSVLNCTGLTGSAGAALGDVFSCQIANQSTLNVSGARVVGFPVRNIIVENQAVLTVPAGGSGLQIRVAQQANLDLGPFTSFAVEVSGTFVVVLTASNTNTLKNKGFSDVV